MPIALQPYTIRFHVFNKKQAEEAYRKMYELGFKGLENGFGRANGLTIEEEKELLAKYDLTVCDVYAEISRPDDAMRLAESFGTKYICVGTIPGGMMMTSDGFYAYCEQLNEQAKPFAEAGYKLSYHNHSQEFRNFTNLNGKAGLQIMIEETDPNGVAFVLDTFWASAAGADPAQWIRKLKGRINLVHFKDYAIDDSASDIGMERIPFRFAEVGMGNVNWQAVTEACRESGVEWYCVEQDLTRGNAFDSLKISVDYMKNVLKL